VCRHLPVSGVTLHRWRNQHGGMKADDTKRVKELERESARLKRIVADKELEIDALRGVSWRKGSLDEDVDVFRRMVVRFSSLR